MKKTRETILCLQLAVHVQYTLVLKGEEGIFGKLGFLSFITIH